MATNGLNQVTLHGNLGQDPDLKVTPGGKAVLNLRLATTTSYVDANSVRQEQTDWHTVTIWGKRAAALSKILRKGAPLLVSGRLQTRSYEKNGEKRYAVDVVAHEIVLTGTKPDDGSDHRSDGAGDTGGEDIPY